MACLCSVSVFAVVPVCRVSGTGAGVGVVGGVRVDVSGGVRREKERRRAGGDKKG